jgi:hypothetical protein
MGAEFQVGELVVMQNASVFEEYQECLAVIAEPLQYRAAMDTIQMEPVGLYCYGVMIIQADWLDGNSRTFNARPDQIRRLSNDDTAVDLFELVGLLDTVNSEN